jgi:hypothetical protein
VQSGQGTGGAGGGSGKKPVEFSNQLPHLLERELKEAKQLGVKPLKVGEPSFDKTIDGEKIKWAVSPDGELRVVRAVVGKVEIKHSVLFNGKPVIAAGEAEIAGKGGNYLGLRLSNDSGHYLPSADSLAIGREAFLRAGIKFK